MLQWIYKRILRKLNLSKDQLGELREKLMPETICKGRFVQEEKNCPTTTAVAIKEGVGKLKTDIEARRLLEKYGVAKLELWIFYTLFDIPAMLSQILFRKTLKSMSSAIGDLISERS